MSSPTRISALAVAILAGLLSVAAVNCQSDPDPTPTTVPTTAPTATEAYIPPTLTPTRTPMPEPTATQTPVPSATASPTTTDPEVTEFNAWLEFDHIARQREGSDTDPLYEVSLIAGSEFIAGPSDQQVTLQLFCGKPSEPLRKCADDWDIGNELATEHNVTVALLAGGHRITVQHNGVPVAIALLALTLEDAADPDSAWVEVVYLSEPGEPREQVDEIIRSWSESFEDSEQSAPQLGDMDESVNEVIAWIEAIDELVKESAPTPGQTGANRLFNVPMIVSYESSLAPDEQPVTLQLFCGYRSQPRRKCADDLQIERNAQAERHISVQLPAGWHNVTVEDNGAPIAQTLVSVSPVDLAFSNEAVVEFHTESKPVDTYAVNETLPPGSNGIVPRVTGYWSDGSANVEIFAGSQSITPTDTLICQIGEQSSQPCNSETSLSTDGRYTRIEMRLPFGVTHLDVIRNNESVLSSHITVSHRTVGIHPDVLDCFTDTTFMDANLTPDFAIGCAGWHQPTIIKWDHDLPLRVRIDGPDQWTDFFKTELEALQTLFNIDFEWIQGNDKADISATVGITHEAALQMDLGCSPEPTAAGCATTGISVENRSAENNHIVIYNLSQDENNPDALPNDETQLDDLRRTILHEAVHAFTAMGHRIEVGSLMFSQHNEFYTTRSDLSPMDRALVELHARPELRGGMKLGYVRQFMIPNDELLDPQSATQEPVPGFTAWQHIYDAFNALRNAASATYQLNASMPTCDRSISAATYQLAKLIPGDDTFQWANLQSQTANLFNISHPEIDAETWSEAATGWTPTDVMPVDLGWIPRLSDPYNMIVILLLSADWNEVIVTNSDGETITFAAGIEWTQTNQNVNIELAMNKESNTITDYSLEWSRGTDTCDEYQVNASNGTYGSEFVIPTEIRANSEIISTCDTHELTTNPRALRVSGKWHHECPAAITDATYGETYRFNTDTWSLLRLDFNAPDNAFLVLTDTSTDSSQTIDRSTGIHPLIGLEGNEQYIQDVDPWQFGLPSQGSYAWHHQWLPPGSYEIQAATREHSYPGRFTLIVDAQPMPGPPESLRFKAVATSIDRTCALLTDGTPLCWGRPHDTSQSPSIPQGTFENIFGGYHYCATTSDGSSQCWDFKEVGEYECTPEERTDLSSRCIIPDQPDFTNEGLVDQSGGFVRAIYFDLTPPDGHSFLAISPGIHHTCGIQSDNAISCWGGNSNGESDPPTGATFTDIETSNGYACGLSPNGQIQCWGDDGFGPFSLPTDHNFTDIGISFSYGYERTCALNEQGEVQCFNRRDFYCDPAKAELINNPCFATEYDYVHPLDPDYIPTPPALYNPAPGHTFVSLSAGAPECGIKADGTARCWHIWPNVGSPPPTETFTQVSAGKHHACGLRTDGTIACWGDNHYGQATPPNGDYITSE